MKREIQDYYEEVEKTFATKGWNLLMEDFTKLLDGMEKGGWDSDENSLLIIKGMIKQQRYINGLPDSLATTYEQLKQEDIDRIEVERSQAEVT